MCQIFPTLDRVSAINNNGPEMKATEKEVAVREAHSPAVSSRGRSTISI
jgi:hypothetical protein